MSKVESLPPNRNVQPRQPRIIAAVVIVVLFLSIVSWSSFEYVGRQSVLLAFHLAFWAALLLAVPRPRLDGYLFLAVFLFLGFWLKCMFHLTWDYAYLEPIGNFDGSPANWDRALGAAAAGAAGVALCRVVHLLICRGRSSTADTTSRFVPSWYPRQRVWVWAVCIIGTLALYIANYQFAFFKVGVNTLLVLPFRLNVLLAWACFCGAALLFTWLIEWELQVRPQRLLVPIIAITALSVVASVSILSRAVTVFLAAAFAVAIMLHMPTLARRFWTTFRFRLLLIVAGSLLISLLAVTWIRATLYFPPDSTAAATGDVPGQPIRKLDSPVARPVTPSLASSSTPAATPAPMPAHSEAQASTTPDASGHFAWAHGISRGLLQLASDRWLGLEGILSVASATDQLGPTLFSQGIHENPARGRDSIYQTISHTRYGEDPNLTFLTLAGAIAILFYSGSLLTVFGGMFIACSVVIVFELLALRLCGSRLLAAVLGIYMANAVCQMNFPYLWFVFLGETLVAILGFYVLRMPWRKQITQ
jgi:hypothetical protein